MRTTIDSYKSRAGRLDLEGIDFDDFKDQPLPADALRSLRYMHDVEHHTVCYLRDLLLTPAHQDPEITSFLSCWVFEEMWHGEAIARVLEAHGEEAGAPRIAALRHGRRRRQALTTLSTIASAAFAGRAFVALHMTWGAINEWTTQAGYSPPRRDRRPPDAARAPAPHHEAGGRAHRLLRVRGDPAPRRQRTGPTPDPLRALALVAAGRFGRDAAARGRLLGATTSSTATKVAQVLERIDRRVDRLPGQGDLHLLTGACRRASPRRSGVAARDGAGGRAGDRPGQPMTARSTARVCSSCGHRHPFVGVVRQQRVAGSEVGRWHPVLPERRDVGPADLGLGRRAAALHQGLQAAGGRATAARRRRRRAAPRRRPRRARARGRAARGGTPPPPPRAGPARSGGSASPMPRRARRCRPHRPRRPPPGAARRRCSRRARRRRPGHVAPRVEQRGRGDGWRCGR